jgi:hypothetical protein
LVQAVQAPNADTAQCTGHGPWSQAWVSAVCGHAAPPKRGATLARLRFCEPTPHDLVQVDQAPKEPSTQSTAHGAALQVRVDHAPKRATTQFTAHGAALQVRVSAECGHALPPNVGATVARLRFCEPAPHDLEQVDHAPKPATEQSVAQAAALQVRVSAECGHALPPNVGSTVARLRFCEPTPHDLVQVDHAPKPATEQSVAQAAALQARVSAECGHALPPNVGSTVARLRCCEPTPHDLVQSDQKPKSATEQSTAHANVLHARASLA